MAQCNAQRRKGAGPCHGIAINGTTKCRFHGGASLRGPASPHWKGGVSITSRHSKMPQRLRDNYDDALQDTRLLELRREIALLDARINDLLGTVDSGESGRLWMQLKKTHGEFARARHAGQVDAMQEKLAEMEILITAGNHDTVAWRELDQKMELRRKLAESERKRIQETAQIVTSDRLVTFMAALMDVLATEITDRKMLNRVSVKLIDMINVEPTHAISEPA